MKRRPGRPLTTIPGLREIQRPEPEPEAESVKRRVGRPRKSLLTVDELAGVLKIGRTSLYNLIAAGCPYLRVGSVRRFDLDKVLYWLQRSTEHRQAADLE